MYFTETKLENVFNSARVIIFNMNGLIIDDEKIKLKVFNTILRNYGFQITLDYWINKCVGHKEAAGFKKIFYDKKILLNKKKYIS